MNVIIGYMKTDTTKKIEMKNDGHETDRFLALAKKVISVPKAEIDKRLVEEQAEKERQKKKAKS